jgi:hypothetical protein
MVWQDGGALGGTQAADQRCCGVSLFLVPLPDFIATRCMYASNLYLSLTLRDWELG